MKKILNSKYGETLILTGAALLNLIFTVIYYSIKLGANVFTSGYSATLWSASSIDTETYHIEGLNVYFIVAFFVGLALFAAAVALSFFKRKKVLFYVYATYSFVLGIALLFVELIIKILSPGAIVCAIISLLISAAIIAFLLVRRNSELAERMNEQQTETPEITAEKRPVSPKTSQVCKLVILICESLATVLMFLTLFLPIYSESIGSDKNPYILIDTLKNGTYPVFLYVTFMVMFVSCFAGLLSFVSTVSFYKSDKAFARRSRAYMYGSTMFTLIFFVAGYCFTFYNNITHKDSAVYSASTVSYIPFLISVAVLVIFSVFYGKSGIGNDIENEKTVVKFKVEPLIYVTLLTLVTFASLLLKIVTVDCTISGQVIQQVSLSGLDLLKSYSDLEAGFQILAFALFAMLITSGIMLILSLVSLVSKNKDYYKILKVEAVANVVFTSLIGLFGFYFKIAQKVNEENIASLLKYFQIESLNYTYNVSGQGFYLLAAAMLVLIIMIIRKQFNLEAKETFKVELASDIPNSDAKPDTNTLPAPGSETLDTDDTEEQKTVSPADFDACPAFTELDGKAAEFNEETEKRREKLFTNLTLPNLVRFVVDYARECRLHLSYSPEDMAAFVAGLGASRLTILQGMSGTGKTSLPKIFAEAVLGNCEIVEVESSWRDKNELLGYYNEFSKCYTPKKFTQCLYKAKLNPEVVTFIVLDEMNLSRIEYYFSDFLSLMENEEDKREIKLLNVKLRRTENGETVQYGALTDGHTLKVPKNVWFIGTANRDESTFAISDKVYDRAQTMNFNKRAPKIRSFGEPLDQRFTPYDDIKRIFDEAKTQGTFEAEDSAVIRSAEKLLAPYNISFGNRILKQIEDFVKIYSACFGDKDAAQKDAVEKILLSKVVSKLENKVVENKETLAAEFDKIGLTACGEFIRKLNED